MNTPPIQPLAPSSPVQFNPLRSDYMIDPYPQLHRLRAQDPVHHSDVLGVWVLTRYEDVRAALRDPRFSAMASRWEHFNRYFLRGATAPTPMAEMYTKWMLQLDPPDHTRLRALVNKSFTPRIVQAMRPQVERMVDGLLDRVTNAGSMEVMSDLAFPLPILVICALLGVPDRDYEKIRTWTHALLPSMSPAISAAGMTQINQVIVDYREYFRELAAQRRREPRDDLLSALIAAREDGQKLSEDELLATCILLAFAGHATTAQLTGKMILALLNHPRQFEKLRDDPSLTNNTIEEACRYESPLQLLYRTTKEPIEIAGKTIPEKQMVFLSLAAANRDPAQFADPDCFDITRDASKHVAFAYGIHFCAGAPLARLEGQIALQAVMRRLKNLRLRTDGVRREPSLIMRGLTELHVTFNPGG